MQAVALTRSEVESRLAHVRSRILELGVHRLALFGSVQRNEARAGSDVDVLVEFDPGMKSFDRVMSLGDLLEHALDRRIELVTLESLSPFIGPHILSEAKDVIRAA